jgi:tetratricopeptide (TPR) repeat protein
MINRIMARLSTVGLASLVCAATGFAQTGPMEGTVKIKGEDGSLKPVQGALVEIFRTDVRGRWEVKTDKSGHYVYLGLPLVGTFIVVASAPGMEPTWVNNVRITQTPEVNIEARPGGGQRLTLEDVQAQIAQMKAGGRTSTGPPAGDRAKLEAAQKAQDEQRKQGEALQASFDAAKDHYNQGIELKKANNFTAALSEFEQAAAVDTSKHAAFVELSHKANANVAEVHYQIGVDLFNQKKRPEAKSHFEKAVEAITKAIAVAPGDTKNLNLNNELLIYYDILAKNTRLLVEHYQAAERIDPVLPALAQAETLDPTNKNKWALAKADIFRFGFRLDEAVTAYQAVLAADANNVDAIFGLGLTYLNSLEQDKLQKSANYLADFIAKAPGTDSRVPAAKEALDALKNQFKVEAEKPQQRRRRP